MTEPHDISSFAEHMIGLIRNSPPPSQTTRTTRTSRTIGDNLLSGHDKSGTTSDASMVRLEIIRTGNGAASRTAKASENQGLTALGTTGTSGTTYFEGGRGHNEQGGAPAEWHAILAELERRNCPEWVSPERWNLLLGDAENFLSRWGHAAHAMGWTALDLYGVHPLVPASRFDVMGFLFFVQGGSIPVITAHSATIYRRTGAYLTYRRKPDMADAILVTEVLS